MDKTLTFCIDFDGTIVKHKYPEIGEEVPDAIRVMQRLIEANHNIILYTMRHDKGLNEAVVFLADRLIKLWGVNENPTQKDWSESRKVYGHYYIDDAALGCPLIYPKGERPYVHWNAIEDLLQAKDILTKEEKK